MRPYQIRRFPTQIRFIVLFVNPAALPGMCSHGRTTHKGEGKKFGHIDSATGCDEGLKDGLLVKTQSPSAVMIHKQQDTPSGA